jgi:hypothetical protein
MNEASDILSKLSTNNSRLFQVAVHGGFPHPLSFFVALPRDPRRPLLVLCSIWHVLLRVNKHTQASHRTRRCFEVQHRFSETLTGSVGYVGTRGTHLLDVRTAFGGADQVPNGILLKNPSTGKPEPQPTSALRGRSSPANNLCRGNRMAEELKEEMRLHLYRSLQSDLTYAESGATNIVLDPSRALAAKSSST